MRLELADAGAFRALIGRIEGKLGQPLPKGERVAGQEYWRLGADDVPCRPARWRVSILVVALAPRQASEGALGSCSASPGRRSRWPTARPCASWRGSAGYQLRGVGYLDTARLLERLAGEHRGVDGGIRCGAVAADHGGRRRVPRPSWRPWPPARRAPVSATRILDASSSPSWWSSTSMPPCASSSPASLPRCRAWALGRRPARPGLACRYRSGRTSGSSRARPWPPRRSAANRWPSSNRASPT